MAFNSTYCGASYTVLLSKAKSKRGYLHTKYSEKKVILLQGHTRSRLVPGCDLFTWDAPRGAAVTTRNCGFGELRMFGVILLGVMVTADCG